MSNNNYQSQVDAAEKALNDIKNKFIDLDAVMTAASKTLATFNTNLKGSGAQNAVKQNAKELEGFTRAAKEAEKQLQKQIALEEKWSRTGSNSVVPGMNLKTQALKEEEKALAKNAAETKKNAQAQEHLSRAYVQLVASMNASKQKLQDYIVLYGKNAKVTREAQKEYDTLSKKVNQANQATSNFAKGGLGQAISGFKNLLGAFGIVGGIQMFANFVTSSYEIIKAFDSLNFAFEKVITNQGELARTQSFLTDLSKKFGVELLATSEKYLKFYVASKNANVATKEIEETFSTFTEAGATLGLSTDKMNRIFTALEQMMSKGTVSSEELRQQLGDSLPAAFELMAKGLGKTTGELQKMLKNGEVLAKDAVPKLAQAVKDFYKLNGEAVDNLQSQGSKLKTAWQEMVTSISNSEWIKITLAGVTKLVEGVEAIFGDSEANIRKSVGSNMFKNLQDDANVGLEEAQKRLAKIREELKIYKEIEFIQRNPRRYSQDQANVINSNGGVKNALQYKVTLESQADALRNYTKYLKDKEVTEKEALATSVAKISNTLELTNAQSNMFSIFKEGGKAEYKSLSELKKIYAELLGIQSKSKEFTIPYYEEKIKANEELRKTLQATNKEDLTKANLINKQNESYQKQIDLLTGKKDKKSEKGDTSLLDSNYSLKKTQLEESMRLQEDFIATEGYSLEERIKAQVKYHDYKNQLIEETYNYEKSKANAQIEDETIRANKLKEIIIERDRAIWDNSKDKTDNILKLQQTELDKMLENSQKFFDEEQLRINKESIQYENKLRSSGKSEKEIKFEVEKFKRDEMQKSLLDFIDKKEIEAKALAKALDEEYKLEKFYQDMRDSIRGKGDTEDPSAKPKKTKEELEAELKSFRDQFQSDFFNNAGFDFTGKFLMQFDEISAMLKNSEQKWADYFLVIGKIAQETMNFIAEGTQKNFDAEYVALDKQKEIALKYAGDSASAKAKIEDDYQKRKRAIEMKQWKQQQKLAISNAVMNTSLAIISTLAQVPKVDFAVSALTLSSIIGGIGAAQIAMIASQKPPEFADGVRNFEGGLAYVGDGGISEVVKTDKGVFSTPNEATLVNLPKGSDVFSSHEEYYQDLLKSMNILPANNLMGIPNMVVQDNGLKASEMDVIIGKHFSKIQTNTTNIDKNGLNTYIQKGYAKTILLNNSVSFKGYSV